MRKIISLGFAVLLSLSFTACAEKEPAVRYVPGTYSAVGQGYNEMIVVVGVEEDRIVEFIINNTETPDIGGVVVAEYQTQVLNTQNIELDVVAGATITSTEIVRLTKEVLAQCIIPE